MRQLILIVIVGGLLLSPPFPATAQQRLPTSTPGGSTVTSTVIRNPRLGLAHISAAEGGTSETRYKQALAMGAQWNRYPIYWDRIETEPSVFDWSRYDIQIADDLSHDFSINAILLGRPAFRADGDRIQGMNEPIFADGSDFPGEGKTINPNNPWALFVYDTVQRYKPGGILAQSGAVAQGKGVTVWEIWNEPDFRAFWSGSIIDYARLLKVAYLAAHHADPNAKVMFGGLLYNTQDNWLARVLKLYQDDPYREQFNWYMDQVAVHSYGNPWRTGWLVLNLRQTLIAYELDHPIWVTETGVPVWDDYPGPTWATSSSPDDLSARQGRATAEQQAWYVIQSAAYAWAEGADVVIYHQLYDDCGDQPPGTDFPPNDGRLCQMGNACSGDAHGFIRNLDSAICFSQSPQPGTYRPAAQAYKLLAQVFLPSFQKGTYLNLDPNAVAIEFKRTLTDERVVVMWSKKLEAVPIKLPAVGENAQLISLNASIMLTPDVDGNYVLDLPAAKPDNYPEVQFGADAAIGGSPYILIERTGSEVRPLAIDLNLDLAPDSAPSSPLTPTLGAIVSMPTVDPANDTQPPQAAILALPEVSPATFTVSWSGQDDSGIASYTVWVRVDGGTWQPWLETSDTSAEYIGQPGSTYEFDVWAVDLAGNWSEAITLQPRAVTRVEP